MSYNFKPIKIDCLFSCVENCTMGGIKLSEIVLNTHKYKDILGDNYFTIRYFVIQIAKGRDIGALIIRGDNELIDGYHRLIALKMMRVETHYCLQDTEVDDCNKIIYNNKNKENESKRFIRKDRLSKDNVSNVR